MRKERFSEEQMVGILREADKDPVAQVAKRHGVSEQTIYTWRQRFSGMNADDVKRLRQLEQENARLKKMLAERDVEIGNRQKRPFLRPLSFLSWIVPRRDDHGRINNEAAIGEGIVLV